MPESLVALTEGSGKNLHTFQRVIGANTVEDQAVILGENYLASYVVNESGPGTAISTATANSHLMQIMAGASLRVRIRRIDIYQAVMATTAAIASVALYRLSTAGTGGTGLTTDVMDGGDAGSGATAMMLPTVKGTEFARAISVKSVYFMQTVGASAQLIEPIASWDFDRPRTKPLIISAGVANGIAIKQLTAIAAASVWIDIWFDESNF